MTKPEKNPTLAKQQYALRSYLDNLLAEVEDVVVETETATASVQTAIAVVEPEPVAEPVAVETMVAEAPVIELPIAKPVVPAIESEVATPEPAVEPQRSVDTESQAPFTVPQWAEEPFPCLLFKVEGLNIEVPMVYLNGVLPWPEEITPMPNHTPWFLGLHRDQDTSVKVVDTALLVVPQDRRTAQSTQERAPLGNIIMIDDRRWGLGCTEVAEMVTLDPQSVRWRSERGQRPWLAGTVIENMCALLDVEAFAHMLETGYR